MKKVPIIFLFFFFFVNKAYSECNFPTGKYIEKIYDPSHILSIKIDIAQNRKYIKNFYNILNSKSDIILPKLKKKFRANLTVYYTFGKCNYLARVRQNGYSRDHIKITEGVNIQRSLDVRLENGNILNAVNFKLFLPETRNGIHEILASIILKKLGFISPETFEVKTSINGVEAVMIFQEKAAKELLEKNLRREGPIFEGDQSLLWSYENFKLFELEPLALSRLINDNWFNKGESSRAITIKSFEKLQQAYLYYAYRNSNKETSYALFPNKLKNDNFINYHSLLLAMNGIHALRPHNRQFYFNAFESTFEPIYYDGNINLLKDLDLSKISNIENLIPYQLNDNILNAVNDLIKYDQLYNDFVKRILIKNDASDFLQKSILQFKTNLNLIVTKTKNFNNNKDYINDIKTFTSNQWYLKFQDNKKLDQKIITNLVLNDNSNELSFDKKKLSKVSNIDIANVISRNQLNKKRVVYIPSKKKINSGEEINLFNFKNKIIKMSNSMKINFKDDEKTLHFIQSKPTDWALLIGGDYSNWKIFFNGMPPNNINEKKKIQQRFNKHGLTGCLTIYNSIIHKTFFSAVNGICEDSVNIVNSRGEDLILEVKDAFADAVDVDFSTISIKFIKIKNSGNDCIDLSGGKYLINEALLDTCIDKAISIGEKSKLIASKIFVKKSNIAISTKDSSDAKISFLDSKDVNLCAEIKQKKQEFGGANLSINNLKCASQIEISSESNYIDGQL